MIPDTMYHITVSQELMNTEKIIKIYPDKFMEI